ncbi:MFS transporter [Xylanibacillus composti]|uniref:MFS transporter n=2 Tax=Xylanibacillus composti TaxID=1572762 RepID=A0A8J4GZP4_9BACL|nr:MFS transporter [Xylanibacillus composti]
MAAIEGTIIATAMPSIVADLGGFHLFSWAFSIYLLMQAVTIPIYGKLADLYGRKPVFVGGVAVFLIGSLLCGFAQSMTQLIVFRLIQGLGAGAVQPIAMTIVGDIYSLEERGKIQGYLASVWGLSSIIGPALGGFFVQYAHWAWVFWVNVPVGLLAAAGLMLFLREDVEKKKRQLDFPGSLLLFLLIGSAMVVFVQGGVRWPWFSTPVLLLTVFFLIAFVLFIQVERRSPEPVVPLGMWKKRTIAVANIGSVLTGALMMGVSTFLPTYVQGVLEKSPTQAGFVLAMMSIGWPLASTISGRLMTRTGFRPLALVGGVFLILGAFVFLTMRESFGPFWPAGGAFLIGVGMGLATTTFVVAVQNAVEWRERGAATASNMFARIVGTTIGASLLGGVLNNRLSAYFQANPVDGTVLDIGLADQILDPEKRQALDTAITETVQNGLVISLHSVYTGVFVLAILSMISMALWPRGEKRRAGTSA